MKGSHQAKSCKVPVKCFKCKIDGDHHTALCEGKKAPANEEIVKSGDDTGSVTVLIDRGKSVLLQTAICEVMGNNDRIVRVKALLDPGSQQTYIINDS